MPCPLSILTCFCSTFLLAQPPPAIDLQQAASAFREAEQLSERDGGKLWGVSLAGPMLFVDRQTRQVVASTADKEGQLRAEGGVFVGKLPPSIPAANNKLDWAGVSWTMVLWPLPRDATARGTLLMHESWHRIQDRLGLPATNPGNQHLDSLEGRLWLQLEWRALAAALAGSGEGRRAAVADALAFRSYRRSLFKEAAVEERSLEMHEGLAEYTGVKLCGQPERELFHYAIKALERAPQERTTFVRSFAYVSGPAYGLLLDDAGQGWRKELKPTHDLGELLRAALKLELPAVVRASVEERAERYEFAKLQAAERKRDEARQQRLADARARLVDGPVLLLPLQKMQFSFDPNEVLPLGELGTVYPTMKLSDEWGVLTVTRGGLITANFQQARVPAPSKRDEKPVKGDGWELQLKDGWGLFPASRSGDYELRRK
jgi:hypothetical protein